MQKFFLFLILVLLPLVTVSADQAGFGDVATNLTEPLNIVANFICTASIIIGATSLFASLIRYLQHRQNPLAMPIGNVIFLLILGIVLLCLPLLYKLSEGETPHGTAKVYSRNY